MKVISTANQQNVKQIANFSKRRSYKKKFAKMLFREGYNDIIHCNGITMGRKGVEYAWYSDRFYGDNVAYGPGQLFTINHQLIKKVISTANNFVFLTELGKVYDLKASILHRLENATNLKTYFRLIDTCDIECVDISASQVLGSTILMKTADGKIRGVGSNGHYQLTAERDDRYEPRVSNIVYDVNAEVFTAGSDYTVCSTDKTILVCGDNANSKLGIPCIQDSEITRPATSRPEVAVLWSHCFGTVKDIVGLLDMIVILTQHHVFVSGLGECTNDEYNENTFRVIDLPVPPKTIYGDATSNVFYVTTASDVFIFNVRDERDVTCTKKVPFLDNAPIIVTCGTETYPKLTFVDELVFVAYDNFNVASRMSRLFELTKLIGLCTTHHLVSSVRTASKKRRIQTLIPVTHLSIPLGDVKIIS
jgi:hypothetical protein